MNLPSFGFIFFIAESAGSPTQESGKEKEDDKEEEADDDVRFATGEKVVTHPAGMGTNQSIVKVLEM